MATRIIHDGPAELTDVLTQARSLLRLGDEVGGYVTIGVFDGVHRGHQQLITRMVEAAHSARSVAIVLVVVPHPARTLGYEPPLLLTTVEECVGLLATLGPDAVIALPFTPATARVQATDFVEMLVHRLNLVALWGGPDLALGHQREGDISFLRRLGAERGFVVHVVEPLVWRGALVSSSRVRAALQAGDVSQAMGCLGCPYRLACVVTPSPPESYWCCPPQGRLVPANGIYTCCAHTEHLGVHPAAVRIVTQPIPAGRKEPVIEVRLPDINTDLRDQVLALDFTEHLSDRGTFPDLNTAMMQRCRGMARTQDASVSQDSFRRKSETGSYLAGEPLLMCTG
jgi:riboflavin kinase / FMN adenylyltransferase